MDLSAGKEAPLWFLLRGGNHLCLTPGDSFLIPYSMKGEETKSLPVKLGEKLPILNNEEEWGLR